MNKIAAILIFLIIGLSTQAQSTEQDYLIIFLEDGSVLKGYLVEHQPPSNGILIKLFNGEEMYIESQYIKSTKSPRQRLQYIGEGRSIKGEGIFGALHFNTLLGYAASTQEDSRELRKGIGTHFVIGHKYSEKFALGVGTGLDLYPKNFLIPVFIDFRGVWNKQPSHVGLAYNLILGHSFHSGLVSPKEENSTWKGGILVHPNIGVRLARRKQANIILDIGYKFQYSVHEFNYWWSNTRNVDRIWYKSLTLRMGWEF